MSFHKGDIITIAAGMDDSLTSSAGVGYQPQQDELLMVQKRRPGNYRLVYSAAPAKKIRKANAPQLSWRMKIKQYLGLGY